MTGIVVDLFAGGGASVGIKSSTTLLIIKRPGKVPRLVIASSGDPSESARECQEANQDAEVIVVHLPGCAVAPGKAWVDIASNVIQMEAGMDGRVVHYARESRIACGSTGGGLHTTSYVKAVTCQRCKRAMGRNRMVSK